MSFARLAVVLLSLLFAGCQPVSQKGGDEQKEPYFLAAKKRLQERDIQGAIDYFEKALDENPRSASAHIELGILYEQPQNEQYDLPAALYHYSRALKLRPDYASADVIKQRIEYCKRELAKSVVQLPSVEVLQRKVDVLAAENQDLKNNLQAWRSYYAGRTNVVVQTPIQSPSPSPAPAPVPAAISNPAAVRAALSPETRIATNPAPRVARPVATSSRMHTVANGETLERIAKKYGIRVSALMAANPSVDARRIRAGQTIVIPTSAP